ncbi:hypothetical protein [Cellulomonas soli]
MSADEVIALPAAFSGQRLDWRDLPRHVRTQIQVLAGAQVTAEISATSGFSPGFAAVLELADGRGVFVKAVSAEQNPHSPSWRAPRSAWPAPCRRTCPPRSCCGRPTTATGCCSASRSPTAARPSCPGARRISPSCSTRCSRSRTPNRARGTSWPAPTRCSPRTSPAGVACSTWTAPSSTRPSSAVATWAGGLATTTSTSSS